MKLWPVFLSCLSFLCAISAQTPDPKPPALCTVQGQFVQTAGGVPLRKVEIVLTKMVDDEKDQVTYAAVADGEGRFKIEHIQPGTYTIEYSRPTFVDAERRHHGSGMLLPLSPGQDVKDLLFHMAPAGAITGKVVESDGDPMGEAIVVALPFGQLGQPRYRHTFYGARATDLGDYRIGGLPPGKYLVVAAAVQQQFNAVDLAKRTREDVPTYPATFYPSTVNREDALPVEIHSGDEIPINLTVVPTRAFRVSGEVSGLNPKPGEKISLVLHSQDGMTMATMENLQPLDEHGKFDVRGVPPGRYEAYLSSSLPDASEIRTDTVVQVTNADVDHLAVGARRSGQVQGRLRLEGGAALDWSQTEVQLDPTKVPDTAGSLPWASVYWDSYPRHGALRPDGTFEIKDVPSDSYAVSIGGIAAIPEAYVKRVDLGGNSVADTGFSIEGGKYSLDVLISPHGATIEGAVIGEKDLPVKGAFVVCLPDKPRRGRRDLYQMAPTDANGHFLLHHVAPGSYQVLALDVDAGKVTSEGIREPEFVKAHESLGETVKVSEGERKTVLLKAVEESD